MSQQQSRQFGTEGRRVMARTNAFELKWHSGNKTGSVHHYDAILPLWETRNEDFKIGGRKGIELMMRLQETECPGIFNPLGAYDGKKNLFSSREYSFTAQEFRVPWEASHSSERRKMVSIKVVYVKQVNFGLIQKLLKGDPGGDSGDAAMTLNMLNVFVQAAPKMQAAGIYNAKSFFTEVDKRQPRSILPLELWRGFFQSVRPTFDRIIVNVDVTVGVIVPGRPLEDIMMGYIQVSNQRDLSRLQADAFQKLRLFTKGLKISINLPGHRGKKPKTIRDLVQRVGERVFDKGGVKVTVADHFKQAHNYAIMPGSLGIKVGHDSLFPAGVCKTIEQLLKNRSSPAVVTEALSFSPKDPSDRIHAIQKGWAQLRYQQSQFLIGAGISISPDPIQVKGRILPPPPIDFGNAPPVHLQRPGVWDVMRKTLMSPQKINSWFVIDLSGERNMSVMNAFVNDLTNTMRERGMKVSEVHSITRASGNADVIELMRRQKIACNAELILVILRDPSGPLYNLVKRFGDITDGIVTQCVRWSHKLSRDAANGRCNQYHNNLILKMNAKLGGRNYAPKNDIMDKMAQVPTMILGADVSHPGPGSSLPSISALVSSWDKFACHYSASMRVQEPRTEIIDELTGMMMHAIHMFQEHNRNVLPHRIFYFRDGVSEGEFKNVRERETSAMRAAVEAIYKKNNQAFPRLTFIIVGKRHHFRFFPQDQQSTDPKGNNNLFAGFVVDQDIAHPLHHDFYLQSQPGLKGTSRPSHYTVLTNGDKWSADDLQKLAYALCHCYSRATRSVKIPAPVYYADLVCRRAKFHFDEDANFSDDMMSTRSVDYFKEHFSDIHEKLQSSMYFV